MRYLVFRRDFHASHCHRTMPVEKSCFNPVANDGFLIGSAGLHRIRLLVNPNRFNRVISDSIPDVLEGHGRRISKLLPRARSRTRKGPEDTDAKDLSCAACRSWRALP